MRMRARAKGGCLVGVGQPVRRAQACAQAHNCAGQPSARVACVDSDQTRSSQALDLAKGFFGDSVPLAATLS